MCDPAEFAGAFEATPDILGLRKAWTSNMSPESIRNVLIRE